MYGTQNCGKGSSCQDLYSALFFIKSSPLVKGTCSNRCHDSSNYVFKYIMKEHHQNNLYFQIWTYKNSLLFCLFLLNTRSFWSKVFAEMMRKMRLSWDQNVRFDKRIPKWSDHTPLTAGRVLLVWPRHLIIKLHLRRRGYTICILNPDYRLRNTICTINPLADDEDLHIESSGVRIGGIEWMFWIFNNKNIYVGL